MKKDRQQNGQEERRDTLQENEKQDRDESALEELEEALDQEDEEEDEPEEDRSMIAVTVMGFAIVALVLIIVVLIVSGVLTGKNRKTDSSPQTQSTEDAAGSTANMAADGSVTVPDITGKTETEAQQLLTAKHLGLKFEGEETSNKKEGTIINQSPAAGAKVSEHSTVTYIRSGGPEKMDFPDVTGEYLADARVDLLNMGFDSIEVKQKHSGRDLGTVIQSSPAGGRQTTTTAKVVLTVSIGEKSKTAYTEDYLGMTASDAAEQAAKNGIICDIAYGESNFAETGTVMSQDVEPGSQVASGTIVTLTVNEKKPSRDELETTVSGKNAESTDVSADQAAALSQVTLKAPDNYTGGKAVFVLVQKKEGREYQIVEKRLDTADFPVKLTLKKVTGISKGTLWLYEENGGHMARRASWEILK